MRGHIYFWLAVVAVVVVPAVAGAQNDPDPTKSKPAPANLTQFRGQAGKSMRFLVTGNTQGGTVWGSGLYTDDSSIAAAAVHAGLLKHGETGVVKVVIVEGQNAYQGTMSNGVQSNNYNAWGGSYKFDGAAQIRGK